jgi:hypothetical protein
MVSERHLRDEYREVVGCIQTDIVKVSGMLCIALQARDDRYHGMTTPRDGASVSRAPPGLVGWLTEAERAAHAQV